MGADIIAFRPKGTAIEPDPGVDPLLRLFTAAADESDDDMETRYQRALPLAREFVDAWIDQPDALVDFLAWAHARGALKF